MNRITYFLLLLSLPLIISAQKFSHPGLLHDNDDIVRMRQLIADGNPVAQGSYSKLLADPKSSASYKMKGPFEIIARDGAFAATKSPCEDDFNAAYYNALMWVLTSDASHASKAMEIIRSYADSLMCISGHDAPLCAGLQGFIFVNACELMRESAIWTKQDTKSVERMLRNVFLPIINDFKEKSPYANGNWGAAVNKMRMAIAVFTDDRKLFTQSIDYYLSGGDFKDDNGMLQYYISPSGQCQETGRDQAHCMLGLGCLAEACEVAWHQNTDLYGALSNRLLLGYEYVAKLNLGYDVPYEKWTDKTGLYCDWDCIGTKGLGIWRNVFEIAYNHYVGRQHLSMPFTAMALRYVRPEGRGFTCDNPGFGSLLFYRNTPTDTQTPIVCGNLDVKKEIRYCLTQLSRTFAWIDIQEPDTTLIPYSIPPYASEWQRRKVVYNDSLQIFWQRLLYNAYRALESGQFTDMKFSALRHRLQSLGLQKTGEVWMTPLLIKETEIDLHDSLDSLCTKAYRLIERLPDDMIPAWTLDLSQPMQNVKDTKLACQIVLLLLKVADTVDQTPCPILSAQRTTGVVYRKAAAEILQRLSSEQYQSRESKPSFLLHSVGDMFTGSEVDYSTIIADCYYLEALLKLFIP